MKDSFPGTSIFNIPGDSISTWALPPGAIGRLGRGKVEDVAFSPDGMYFAVGTRIGVWIYELSSINPIALWETERGMVSSVTFSPCGKRLAVANWDGLVKIWDVQHAVCIVQMECPLENSSGSDRISQIVFSPDGQHVAASSERKGTVCIWHSETGTEITRLSGGTVWRNSRLVRPLTFSPDNCLLACASPDETPHPVDFISIWDVGSGERIATLRGHTAHVYALTFSPCGQFIASGDSSGALRVWDVSSAKTVKVLTDYAENNFVVPSYLSCGTLLAAGVKSSKVSVWDVESNEKLGTFECCGNVSVTSFSNGIYLAVASPFEFSIWTAGGVPNNSSLPEHTHVPFSLTFSPDGQTLISVGSGLATCWDIVKKQRQQMLSHPQTVIRAIHFSSAENMRVIGSSENILCTWDVDSPNIPSALTEHQKSVCTVACIPTKERWASADIEGKLYVWDGDRKLTTLDGHTDAIISLAFTPDGNRLASASEDNTARFWDVTSGKEIASLSLIPLLDIQLYKGDPFEIQRRQKEIQRQQDSLNNKLTELRPIRIESITISPCGRIIAGGLWREIRLWDATTYEIKMSILPPIGCYYPFALAFSPCGQYLASGSWWQRTEKVSIRLWEVATGKNIATFWGHPTDIQNLAFTPDGTLLASGSFDGTILLWDMKPYLKDT